MRPEACQFTNQSMLGIGDNEGHYSKVFECTCKLLCGTETHRMECTQSKKKHTLVLTLSGLSSVKAA